MKEQERIPVSKVQRATKFLQTGAKIGGNYLSHYGKKIVNPEITRSDLDEKNAEDIYDSLSTLKGSALKVAQMLSMDKNVLPVAYQEKFALSQYSAPPLSYPLVVKTFLSCFGHSPRELFDTFSRSAVNAASIGQVHKATRDDLKLAVKIQYPGVRDSISSDLKMVRPIASAMLSIPSAEMDQYMGEVESKLIEETDYNLELQRSMNICEKCGHLEGVVFPTYYPDLSSERILTMSWIDGKHVHDWIKKNPHQEFRDRIGQSMWDFYDYQIHQLKEVHADPHPGNFIITKDEQLGIIDFGCVKVIPEDFYQQYFRLMHEDVLNPEYPLEDLFMELGFLVKEDTAEQRKFFTGLFTQMIELLGRPFRSKYFDFGNDEYFSEIYQLSNDMSTIKEIRKSKTARGNKHGLYINRTYFGLFSLLNQLKSTVLTS